MGKVWTYIILNIGLAMLLLAAGITTSKGGILDRVGIIENGSINTSALYIAIFAFLGLAAIGSIAIGFFTKSSSDIALRAPFAVANLGIFISSMTGIIQYFKTNGTETWIAWVVSVVFSLLAVGFLISLIDWSFGGDN